MEVRRLGAFLVAVWLLGWPAGAAGAPFAYVSNNSDDTVSVLDTATNTVTATVAVGDGPRGVAVHPDGTRVYVANANDNTVSVLDTATNTVTATVAVGDFPRGVAVHPDGTRVYVANSSGASVSVLDTATNTVAATVAVGAGPRGVAVHPDGTRAYVANVSDNTVSVLDTATNTVTATVVLPNAGLGGAAVHPDGTFVYLTDSAGGSVLVLSGSSNNFLGAVFGAGIGAGDLAVDPDGALVFVTSAFTNELAVHDTAINQVTANVRVGDLPQGVAVHPDGTRVYVANLGDDTVSVMVPALLAGIAGPIIATVPVGDGPQDVAVDPRPTLSISTNAVNYQAGDQFTVSVSTNAGDPRSERWFLIVALVTPANTSEDPFFIFQFDPEVKLLSFQKAVNQVGQGSFADISARPLQTISTESFTILKMTLPDLPAGAYQWLAVLFKEGLGVTSEAASAAFTVQ